MRGWVYGKQYSNTNGKHFMGKEYRDIKYKVFAVRLSDEVIEELKKRRLNAKSWNLLFKELLNKQKK